MNMFGRGFSLSSDLQMSTSDVIALFMVLKPQIFFCILLRAPSWKFQGLALERLIILGKIELHQYKKGLNK